MEIPVRGLRLVWPYRHDVSIIGRCFKKGSLRRKLARIEGQARIEHEQISIDIVKRLVRMSKRPDKIFHLQTTQWKLNEQGNRDSHCDKGRGNPSIGPPTKGIPACDSNQNQATDRAMKITISPTMDLSAFTKTRFQN